MNDQPEPAPEAEAPAPEAPVPEALVPEAPDQPPPLIMIIRHGEKPAPSGKPYGVNLDGVRDINSLTPVGWARAGALAELFAPVHGEPLPGLRRPDVIYASSFAGGRSRRSLQTALGVAVRLGLEIDHSISHHDERRLAKKLRKHTGAALVAWHHRSIHGIIDHLGPVTPTPPLEWPSSRFDVVWTFTRSGDGWEFGQVLERLMPYDLAEPIQVPAVSDPGIEIP